MRAGGVIGKGGPGALLADGTQAAQGWIEHAVAVRFTISVESLDIGADTDASVNFDSSHSPGQSTTSLSTYRPGSADRARGSQSATASGHRTSNA